MVVSPRQTDSAGRRQVSRVWLALGVVYVAWGSTYVGIRIMDRTVPPLIGAGIRYVAAGLLMYVLLALLRRQLPAVSARELGSVALVGVLLLTGGNGFVSFAERQVPAGLAALVVASVPLWLLLFRYLTGERPAAATLGGLGVGFVGVALLVIRGGQGQGVNVWHVLIVLGASLSWALGTWVSPRLPMPADAATGTALEMLIGGALLALLGPLVGEDWGRVTSHASAASLEAIAYLALIGSILAFTAYVWLLRHAPISQVSTYAYVNPAVAVLLGALLLGERITAVTAVAGVIILGAVAVVIRAERAPPASVAVDPAA
ncbi:MAG: EamA family transporter [Solirubrobacterales bacterium]|nr:EamA family transporter [Solirubrobacterales bacterium]